MTISIELDDSTLTNLRNQADTLGLSMEEHACRILRSGTVPTSSGIPASEEAFQSAMEATFRKNDELYRRLAK